MAKKVCSLLLLFIFMNLAFSTALAVEKVIGSSNTSTIIQNDGGAADFLLSRTGKVCGLLYGEKLPAVSMNETAAALSFGSEAGKLVRSKATHLVTLTPDDKVDSGASRIAVQKVEILDSEVFLIFSNSDEELAASLIDATIEAEEVGNGRYNAYHRFFDSNVGEEIARLYVDERHYVSVRYADWDSDGDMEFGLRAGLKSTSSHKGSSNGGSSGGSSGGNSGGSSGNEPSKNEPNPHYRDWADSSSSGSSSGSNSGSGSGEPNPHFR